MIPEWCPQWAWDGAAKIDLPRLSPLERMYTRKEIARALLDAHQRGRHDGMRTGRKKGMEEAAELAGTNWRGAPLYRDGPEIADAIHAKAKEVKELPSKVTTP